MEGDESDELAKLIEDVRRRHTALHFRCDALQSTLDSKTLVIQDLNAQLRHMEEMVRLYRADNARLILQLQGSPLISHPDISDGQESVPIPASNDIDDEKAPPGTYITSYRFDQGIPPRPPPPSLPPQFANDPHRYLATLNKNGALPYTDEGTIAGAVPVLYECGPWCACPHGRTCPQAVSQRGLRTRLEVFKTRDRGWGVRTLEHIPKCSFICEYIGDVYEASTYDRLCYEKDHDDSYSMNMGPRGDDADEGDVQYVVCGLWHRNVAAFFNHSCAPNCFVQPILVEHHDLAMPRISLFSATDIGPYTELTYDYGDTYMRSLAEGCKCGTSECIFVQKD